MQLTPHYGPDPLITLDGPPAAIAEPAIRQRRRLVEVLAGFTEDQWSHPSRCEGWSNRDVIVHLESTNAFWSFSIAAGLGGTPTQFLATFDPVASPAQLVADAGAQASAEVLERFTRSTDALEAQLVALDDTGWTTIAEAPPGHVTVTAVVHHALWDSLIHERDILLPLGIDPTEEPDEIVASLRYAAALAPGLAVAHGTAERGVLGIEVTDPDAAFHVEVGDQVSVCDGPATGADLVLGGDAVELLDALSIRRPLDATVPPEQAWLVTGLAQVFDHDVT